MPFGLTQAPAHFQRVVEAVLGTDLPLTVYLDDIAVYGDDPDEVLDNTAEAMNRLAQAGFMINLKKSHLCQETLKILGHRWHSGGLWYPEPAKLQALKGSSEEEIRGMSRSHLYGLLNFYREYVPTFAEMTEPLRKLLSQDSKPWT